MAAERVQISLNPEVSKMLNKLTKITGLNRSAMITTLITKEWREAGFTIEDVHKPD